MSKSPNMRKCDCAGCKRNKEFKKHIALMKEFGLNYAAEFFEGVYNDLCHVEFDNDVNKAIIAGTWTDADKLIEQARQAQKEQNKDKQPVDA